GGLPRTRHPGDHGELPPGDGAGDVLQIVGAGTDDFDVFPGHILLLKRHYSSHLRDTNILKNKGLLVNSYPRGGNHCQDFRGHLERIRIV
ncbi:MAG: hypothetical protein HWN66_22375, partial [Candidatus Helarchaeota archaeon]|nr:hypothetical protein [Candidatus Helarchaeota archaeon]